MKKNLKQIIQNVEDKVEIPDILPSFNPANKQDFINKMADKVLSGNMTYYDIGRELQLTNNQIEFCKEFVSGEYAGNGTRSAVIAYELDYNDKMARQMGANYAVNFLKPFHPCSTLMQIMMAGNGVNDINIDRNLLWIAEQKQDLKSAVLALRELNTLRGRNNTKKIEVTVSHKLDYSTLPTKDLQKLIDIAKKAKIKEDEND